MIVLCSSSSTATTEEFSEYLSTSQMSDDFGDEPVVMPAPPAPATAATLITSQQHDKSLNFNSMIHMASFLEEQADYNRDDIPSHPSEHQTPTADK